MVWVKPLAESWACVNSNLCLAVACHRLRSPPFPRFVDGAQMLAASHRGAVNLASVPEELGC